MVSIVKFFSGIILISAALTAVTFAQDNDYPVDAKSLGGSYRLYSRDVGDWGAPRRDDTKVHFETTGPLAIAMFNNLGPSAIQKSICGDATLEEVRKKGDVDCAREKKTGDTRCYFSVDMRTGKSRYARVC